MAKKLFISYSHADARWLERLHKHLAQLKREGSVEAWYDREITAGSNLDEEIARELACADIFIAALSPDFIASNYCYEIELTTAFERETSGSLVIVPVVFEPCDWLATPLRKFKALPDDGKPVSEFSNENVALLGVTNELRRLISNIREPSTEKVAQARVDISSASRYRIKRDFDRVDKRDFINRAFEEIRAFFESSVTEISSVPDIEADISNIDKESFSCTVVNRGFGRAFETVTVRRSGSGFGDIDIAYGERPARNSSNGGFIVDSDEYEMFFSSGLYHYGGSDKKHLNAVEVAQIIWDDLLHKVGIDYA